MNLDMLSFYGDRVLDKKIKEQTNYCDNSHIYRITYAVTQLILAEISPCDLDGHRKLTVILNIEQKMNGNLGYNFLQGAKVSVYNLDEKTSRSLYEYKSFDLDFQRNIANILLDILIEIDKQNENKAGIAGQRAAIIEKLEKSQYYEEILLDKFSKVSRDRKYKAMIFRCIGQKIGEGIRCDIVDYKTKELIKSKWITNIPGSLNHTKEIQKTIWEGNRFEVIWKGIRKKVIINL